MAKSLQELLAETRGVSSGLQPGLAALVEDARRTASAPASPRNPMRDYVESRKAARKLAEQIAPKPPPLPQPAPSVYVPDASDFPPQPETPMGLVGRQGPTAVEQLLARTRRIVQEPTEAEKAVMLAQSGRYTPGVPIEEQRALGPMGPAASSFARELVAPYPVAVESTTAPKTTGEKIGAAAAGMAGRALNPLWRTIGSLSKIGLGVRMGTQAVAGEVQRALSGEKVTPQQAALNVGVSTAFGLASDKLAPLVQRSLANTIAKHFPETLPKGIERAIPYIAPVATGATVGAARGTVAQIAKAIQGEPIDIGQAVREIGLEAAIMGAVNGALAGVGIVPKGRGADFYRTARLIIDKGGTGQWTVLPEAPSLAFRYDPKTASVNYMFGAVPGPDGTMRLAGDFAKFSEAYQGVPGTGKLIGASVPSVGPATAGEVIVPSTRIAPPQAGTGAIAPAGSQAGSIAPAGGTMQVGQQYALPPELGGLRVGLYDPKTVGVDPERFQFKTTGKEGVTGLLKGVSKWRPDLAGRVLIWEDKSGKPWIVNGHHRLELAKRLNVPAIEAQVVREVDGVTEKMARMRGALANIAEGRGDATDVARFLRDSGLGPDDLREEGISLREKTAAQGVALSGLTDQLWRSLLEGDLRQDLAVIIGRDLPGDTTNQQAVVELIARMEKQGRHITPTILEGVIAQVKSAETSITSQTTLFGEDAIVSTSAVEKAEALEYILKQLRAQKALFNKVSKSAYSQLLEKAGNKLATEKNLEELTNAEMGMELVQQLAYTKGSAISEVLNRAAQEMVTSQNRDAVKRAAFDEILNLVKEGKALEEPIAGEASLEPVQAGPSLFGTGGGEEEAGRPALQVPPEVGTEPEGQGAAPAEQPAAEVIPSSPRTFEGWHTPTIAGKESLASLQSVGLPNGYFVALDEPFESGAHDLSQAQRVSVQVKKTFDPDGLLDPANRQSHGPIAREMTQAVAAWTQKSQALAGSDVTEFLWQQRQAATDFLRARGFDSYIRGIDGDPKNRELIVFQEEQPTAARPEGQGGLMAEPEAGPGEEFTEEPPPDLAEEFSEEMPPDLMEAPETEPPAVQPPAPEEGPVSQKAMPVGQPLAEARAEEAKPPAKAKEPWQMTYRELRQIVEDTDRTDAQRLSVIEALYPEDTKRLRPSVYAQRPDITRISREHRRTIREALAEGQPVPPEVLAEYPDLKETGANVFPDSVVKQPVYHGSGNAGIEEFFASPEEMGANTGARTARLGAFFSEDPDIARIAAFGFNVFGVFDKSRNPTLYEVKINLRHPLDVDNLTSEDLARLEKTFPGITKAWHGEDKFDVLRVIAKAREPEPYPDLGNFSEFAQKQGVPPEQIETLWADNDAPLRKEYMRRLDANSAAVTRSVGQKILKGMGYDGIIVTTMTDSGERIGPKKQYVVFDKKNIKILSAKPVAEAVEGEETAGREPVQPAPQAVQQPSVSPEAPGERPDLAAKPKEPWEMAPEEYVEQQMRAQGLLGKTASEQRNAKLRFAAEYHRLSEQAFIDGKHVLSKPFWAKTFAEKYGPLDQYSQDDLKRFREEHAEDIAAAIREGKPVPPEVLADYPDLRPAETLSLYSQMEADDRRYSMEPAKRGFTESHKVRGVQTGFAEPRKTVKAYKLFRTLATRPGEIFPLFIGKTKPTPMGKWIPAEAIPTKGYAERPGWHAGALPYAPHLMRRDGSMPADRVWAEVELPADVDWQHIADQSSTRDIRDRVPEGGHYKFQTSKMQGGFWYIGGAIKVNRVLSTDEVKAILQERAPDLLEGRRTPLGVLGLAQGPAPGTATAVPTKSGQWYPLYVTQEGKALYGKAPYGTRDEALGKAQALKRAMEQQKEGVTNVSSTQAPTRGETQRPGGTPAPSGGPVQGRDIAPGAATPPGRPSEVPAEAAPTEPAAKPAEAPAAGKREVVNARPHIKPPDITEQTRAIFDAVPEIHASLKEHQVEGTLYALQAMNEKGAFACVDGPGTGKTRVGLAVGYIAARDGKAVLVLTEGERVVRGAWLSEAEKMGIAQRVEEWPAGGEPVGGLIQVAMYSKMRSNVKRRLPLEGWDLVVLDECHNLKNTEKDVQQAAAGDALVRLTPQVLFMSATPFDRIHEYWYMGRRLGTFKDPLTFEKWLDDLGVRVVEKKLRVTRKNRVTGEEEQIKIPKKVYQRKVPIEVYAANLRKMGDQLTRDGLMIKREICMDGLDVILKTVPLPEEALNELDDIAIHYRRVFHGSSKSVSLTVMMQRRFLEKYKIDNAVQIAREELAQGRQVGIFVEYKNDSEVEEKVRVGGELIKVGTVAYAESVIRDLRAKLTEFVPAEQIAEIHGGLPGEKPPDAEAERLAFQAGEKKVVISTISMGSTGISLHDETGKAPRTQIVVTLPWSGVKQVQVAGRMHRLNSLSRSRLIYLMADHEMDEHLAEILAGKMAILGATVQGDLKKLDLKRGELLADLDEATVRGDIEDEDEGEQMDDNVVTREARETQLYDDMTEEGLQRIDLAGPPASGNGLWMAKLSGTDPKYGFVREFLRAKRSDQRHAYYEVQPGAIYEINDVAGRRILQATGNGWIELSGPTARAMLGERELKELGKRKPLGFISKPGPQLTQLGKGGKPKKGVEPPASPASIMKYIHDRLTPIFSGHLSLKTKAEYHPDSEAIRLKEYKLNYALHELGHHLDEQFQPYADLVDQNLPAAQRYCMQAAHGNANRGQIPADPKKARREIAAELFVGLMIEPDVVTNVDPAFNQFDIVLQAMGLEEEIGTVRAQCKEYMGMSLEERMKAQIVWTADRPDKLRWKDLAEAVFDQFDGIRRGIEAGLERSSATIRPSEDAYLLAQLCPSRSISTADHWLTVGQMDKLGNITGPSLKDILEPVKGPEETENFVMYATAKVALHRIDRFDQQMPESRDFYEAYIKKWETPERLKIFENVTRWNMNYLKFLQTVSEPWADTILLKWEKDHPFYLPLWRSMDERPVHPGLGTKSFASVPNPIKKSHGSTRPFLNPILNLVQNTYLLANFAMRNEVGKAYTDLLDKFQGTAPGGTGIPRPVTKQPFKLEQLKPYIEDIVHLAGGDPKKVPGDMYDTIVSIIAPIRELAIESESIISVWHQGKPKYYQLPPDLFQAFRALGARSLSVWMKILGYPARFLHRTAIATPSFALLRNPATDIQTAFKYSAQGQKPFVDWLKGLVMVIKKDPTIDAYRYMGGTFMKPTGWDRQQYEQDFLPQVLDFQQQQRGRGVFRVVNPLFWFEALERVAETLELPSRVREVKLTLQNPRYSSAYDNLLEATYNGLEVTMNWAKAGSAVKSWSSVAPFFSTRFVTAKKTFDMWTGKPLTPSGPPRPGAWKGLLLKSLLMYSLPTLALFAINRKNKDYEELADWRKVGFWNIPVGNAGGRTVFLPIPRGSWEGLLFGGLLEDVLVNLYTEDKIAVDEFLGQVAQDMIPSFLPTFFQYMLIAANLDPFTKRPIVPEREKDLPPAMQTAPWSTAVARLIGSTLGISPRKIDAAVKAYSGGTGSLTTELLNLFLDGLAKSGRLPQEHPANWIGLRGFLVDPYQSSDSIDELYDVLDKSRKAMARARQGLELSATEAELASMNSMYEEGARMLSACRSTERDIRNMTNVSKTERAKAIDLLRAVEIDIARMYLGKSPLSVPDVKE